MVPEPSLGVKSARGAVTDGVLAEGETAVGAVRLRVAPAGRERSGQVRSGRV